MNGQARSSLSMAPDEIYSARLMLSHFLGKPFVEECFLKSFCSLPTFGDLVIDFLDGSMMVAMVYCFDFM